MRHFSSRLTVHSDVRGWWDESEDILSRVVKSRLSRDASNAHGFRYNKGWLFI